MRQDGNALICLDWLTAKRVVICCDSCRQHPAIYSLQVSSHGQECESLHDGGLGLNFATLLGQTCGRPRHSNSIKSYRSYRPWPSKPLKWLQIISTGQRTWFYMILTVFAKVWRSIHAEFARAASLLQAGSCIKENLFVDADFGKIWWSPIRDDTME